MLANRTQILLACCGLIACAVFSGCRAAQSSASWPFRTEPAAFSFNKKKADKEEEQQVAQESQFESKVKPVSYETTASASNKKKKGKDEIEFKQPVSLAAIWVDSVLSRPGKDAVRGFGGRFFFYDETGATVRVEGDLTIYAYDDSNEESNHQIADRKYVFKAEELQSHWSESDMGPAYNFWIPWGTVKGPRLTVALLPVFKSSEGVAVRGEQSLNVLPGTTVAASSSSAIEHVSRSTTRIRSSYGSSRNTDGAGVDRPLTENDYNQTQVRSTTIEVPARLARHMSMRAQGKIPMPESSGKPSAIDAPVLDQSGRPLDPARVAVRPVNRSGSGSGQPSTRMPTQNNASGNSIQGSQSYSQITRPPKYEHRPSNDSSSTYGQPGSFPANQY